MKRRMFISLVIIAMAMAAITGGTLAWFTAEADPIVNTFTAGTVDIAADEKVSWNDPSVDWSAGGSALTNWNPGDCHWKEFRVRNTGTKGIYIRALFEGSWTAGLSDDNVEFNIEEGNWTLMPDGYYYYNEDVAGADGETILEANMKVNVCLDGPSTGNIYQGETYTLTAIFEAIQSSHDAAMTWGVAYVIFAGDGVIAPFEGWLVLDVGGETATFDGVVYTWTKQISGKVEWSADAE